MQDLILLILLMIANGAPIGARLVFGKRYSWPVDSGISGSDGRRFLGDSKTWRGVFAAMFITPIAAVIMGLSWQIGLMLACLSMLGDIFSSFVKRRLGMTPSSMAFGLDQIPETLLPLAVLASALNLTWSRVLYLVIVFLILELIFSRILYKFRIRQRPY